MKTDLNSESYKEFHKNLTALGFNIHETENAVTLYLDNHSLVLGLNILNKKQEVIDITTYPIKQVIDMFINQVYRRGIVDGREEYRLKVQKACLTEGY